MSAQKTDAELEAFFAAAGTWMIRGGPSGHLGMAPDLQSALVNAWEKTYRDGHTVMAIVKLPSDEIIVPPEQIRRLWKLFTFDDGRGHLIRG